MGDNTMKASSFNRSFQERVEMALLDDEIATKLTNEAKEKSGNQDYYHGLNDQDTSLVQRVANVTFQDTNSSEFRTQLRVQDALKLQAQQLQDELKRQKVYAQQIKETLGNY